MIYAFEPNPESYDYAARNITLNNLKNVSLKNVALSDSNTILNLEITGGQGRKKGGAATIVSAPSRATIKVKSIALDSILDYRTEVSIIQLDAEGYEDHILKGACKLITKQLPFIISESRVPHSLQRYLGDLGYKYKDYTLDRNYLLTPS